MFTRCLKSDFYHLSKACDRIWAEIGDITQQTLSTLDVIKVDPISPNLLQMLNNRTL